MWSFKTAGMLIPGRKNEPAHYMLKIESFSLLSEAGFIKFESDVFEACGHQWRLELYPNGNEDENGGNHISLYLIICGTLGLPKGWKIQVDVNVYVYDHLRCYYDAFQGVDGNRTRFHEKKIEWGLHKLISLDSFKDSRNGYLFNDSCVFGVKVFLVSKYAEKDRCLSVIKPPADCKTYTWTIYKFSTEPSFLSSEEFKVGGVKWKLWLLYRHGRDSVKDTDLAIYLDVLDAALLPDGCCVYAKWKLRVKNQSGVADIEKEFCKWFSVSDCDWGYAWFMTLNDLCDSTKGFLLNDRLIVEAEILLLGILKNNI